MSQKNVIFHLTLVIKLSLAVEGFLIVETISQQVVTFRISPKRFDGENFAYSLDSGIPHRYNNTNNNGVSTILLKNQLRKQERTTVCREAIISQQPSNLFVSSKNVEVFEALKRDGWFSSTMVFDNNLDGVAPCRIDL